MRIKVESHGISATFKIDDDSKEASFESFVVSYIREAAEMERNQRAMAEEAAAVKAKEFEEAMDRARERAADHLRERHHLHYGADLHRGFLLRTALDSVGSVDYAKPVDFKPDREELPTELHWPILPISTPILRPGPQVSAYLRASLDHYRAAVGGPGYGYRSAEQPDIYPYFDWRD